MLRLQRFLRLFCVLAGLFGIGQAAAQTPAFKALVFSKTPGERHTSITNGILAIQQLAATNNFTVDATEDSTAFTERPAFASLSDSALREGPPPADSALDEADKEDDEARSRALALPSRSTRYTPSGAAHLPAASAVPPITTFSRSRGRPL